MIKTIEVLEQGNPDKVILVNSDKIFVVETFPIDEAREKAIQAIAEHYDLEGTGLFIHIDDNPGLDAHPDIDRIELEEGTEYAETMPGYWIYNFSIQTKPQFDERFF